MYAERGILPSDFSRIDMKCATLFVVSAYSLSKGAFNRLEAAAEKVVEGPVRLVRLEESGPSLIDALDMMRADGYLSIRVQPLGVPFPESLINWLPGVLADWRMRGHNADTQVTLGPDPAKDIDALEQFVGAAVASSARSVEQVRPRLGKPGWNAPPDFEFHLLVCSGPRCMVHGAATFPIMLKEELKAAGIFDRCLTTRSGCIYPCNQGPVLVLYPHGHWYRLPDQATIRRFVREVLVEGGTAEDLRFHTARVVRENHVTNLETTL